MTGKLEGKVAFITGAARGQGRSHAVRMAEEGADIIATDICEDIPHIPYGGPTEADLDETVKQVEALDRRIIATVADVRDPEAMRSAVDDGVARLGRLDTVSANAGISGPMLPTVDVPDDAWQQMIDINLTGVWRTCKLAIPHIIEGGRGGSMILTSSTAGLMGMANIAHYVAAKHGVVGLMRTLALELAEHNIRVNSVHPTTVDTPMVDNEETFRIFLPENDNPTKEDFGEAAKEMNALPIPWVEARDISNAVLWLASDEARYVTGITLPVDAGALAS